MRRTMKKVLKKHEIEALERRERTSEVETRHNELTHALKAVEKAIASTPTAPNLAPLIAESNKLLANLATKLNHDDFVKLEKQLADGLKVMTETIVRAIEKKPSEFRFKHDQGSGRVVGVIPVWGEGN